MSRQINSYTADTLHDNVAKKLQDARVRSNVSQVEAARFIGVSSQQYKKYEMGVNRISAVTLQKLAILFKVEIGWFFQMTPSELDKGHSTQALLQLNDNANWESATQPNANASVLAETSLSDKTLPPPVEIPGSSVRAAHDTKHILLVDDEPDILRLTASFLRKAGFRVSEATGGDSVLERLVAGERFDALVTDYALAGMSGLGLIDTMREIAPNLPVLVVTGHSRDRDLIFGLPPRVQILSKPYSRNLFLAYIERLVGLPHKGDRLKEDFASPLSF